MIGVDKTQSFAIDEIFGRAARNQDGGRITSKVFRKTDIRTTTLPSIKEKQSYVESRNTAVNEGSEPDKTAEIEAIEEEENYIS